MSSRNVDKGREAENAVAAVFQANGFPYAERRSKRGGTVMLDGVPVPADAGDLTGIPGLVVQVKWSGYKSLAEDMRRTEEQRRVAGADVGLLVRKRPGVGAGRAGEWDAYLPQWAVAELLYARAGTFHRDSTNIWHTDLQTVVSLLALAGYTTPDLIPVEA